MTESGERWDFRVGLILGLLAAATVVSVTGVGIDMVLYAALVLLCRADLNRHSDLGSDHGFHVARRRGREKPQHRVAA